MKRPFGVFGLEGHSPVSINALATLRLLQKHQGVAFFYQGPVTFNQFWNYLDRWLEVDGSVFPILFLAFHGDSGKLMIGDERVSLDELATRIDGLGKGKWLHISACSTLKISENRIRRFVTKTQLEGISGYQFDVTFIDSFLHDYIALRELTGGGLSQIRTLHE